MDKALDQKICSYEIAIEFAPIWIEIFHSSH